MRSISLIMLLFACLSVAPLAWSATDPCAQPVKKAVEDWGQACSQANWAQNCGVSPDTKACDNAKDEDKTSVDVVEQQYKDVCTAKRAYDSAVASCGSSNCNSASAGPLSQMNSALTAARSNLSAEIKKLKEMQKALVDEIKIAAAKSDGSTSDGRNCLVVGHDLSAGSGGDLKDKLDAMAKSPASKSNDASGSRITEGYGQALKATEQAIEGMNIELNGMKNRQAGIGPMLAKNALAAKNANTTPDNSTVTGGNSTSTSASTSSSGGGGGGGSAPGGGGSGSGSPSSISNASDTSMNTATGTTADSSSNGSPSPSDSSHNPQAAAAKGGVTNSLGTPANPSDSVQATTSPYVPPPYVDPNASGASRGLASLRSGSAFSPATGSASGGGSGAGLGVAGDAAKPEAKSAAAAAKAFTIPDTGGGGGSGGSMGGGDESLNSFSKPLSDPKFSLAGSDTDASVKKMIGALGADGADPTRTPASDDVVGGIGDREGADLFDRVHSYHERCQQKGCVAGLHRRKVGGV